MRSILWSALSRRSRIPDQRHVPAGTLCPGGLSSTYASIGDSGQTLTLDGKGEDDSGGLSLPGIDCALNTVGMPQSVRWQVGNTRALDGMQTASWAGYTAKWNYHPRAGLSMVITSTR